MKKIASLTEIWIMVEKAFADNWGYPLFFIPPKSFTNGFFKVSCDVFLKWYEYTFVLFCNEKALIYLALWIQTLLTNDFIASSAGHLENIGFMTYKSSKHWHNLLSSIRHITFKCSETVKLCLIEKFSTFLLSPWKLEFCYWQQSLPVVFLKWLAHFIHFWGSLPNAQMWWNFISVSFSFK